ARPPPWRCGVLSGSPARPRIAPDVADRRVWQWRVIQMSADQHGHKGHDHAVTATGANRNKLIAVLAITVSVMLIQAVGAWISGSLSLLADAGHMLSDAAGVGIALLAATLAARPATDVRTYGWQRAEILAAMINAMVLCGVGVLVIREAILRWSSEPEVASGVMLGAAVLGGIANLISMLILTRARDESLNMRGAYLEVFGDLVGSVAVIVAAVVIMTTGWMRAD